MLESATTRQARERLTEATAMAHPQPAPEQAVEELVTELAERVAKLERATEKMRPDVTK